MWDFELSSLLVSIIAVAISAFAFVRSQKLAAKQLELERQQTDLANKQLEQIHEQERAAGRAHIDVEWKEYKAGYVLYINNDGHSDASNVDLEWITESPKFISEEVEAKLPIERLRPGKTVKLRAAIYIGGPRHYRVIVKWSNPDGSDDSDELELYPW